jgi:hypothetical protein
MPYPARKSPCGIGSRQEADLLMVDLVGKCWSVVSIPLFVADAAHDGGAVEYNLVTDMLRVIMEALRWRYGCARSVDAMHMVLATWGSQSWAVTFYRPDSGGQERVQS